MSHNASQSLGRRLSGWLALQSLLVLAGVCAGVYAVTAASFGERQSETLLQKEVQIRHLIFEAANDLGAAALRHKLDDFLIGHPDLSLSLRRQDGTELYATSPPLASYGMRAHRFSTPASTAGEGDLSVILQLDTRDDRLLLRRIGLALLAAALAGTAMATAGGFALVRAGLKPVGALGEQIAQLAADTLHRRLDGAAQPQELHPLIVQFNDLLGRLERAYELLEGFNADVAHELCTPLSTLIGNTELALRRARSSDELREVMGSNLDDLQRIALIVQDMLFLSQAERGAQARRRPVESIAALARQIADYHEASVGEAAMEVHVAGDASGAFDVQLLQRALSNLLANATRHGERGSVIRVEIESHEDNVGVVVVNRGEPIAAVHLPRLFDRFYRADSSHSQAERNHGLGLSIVAAIARMHGGSTTARSADGVTSIGFTLRNAAEST